MNQKERKRQRLVCPYQRSQYFVQQFIRECPFRVTVHKIEKESETSFHFVQRDKGATLAYMRQKSNLQVDLYVKSDIYPKQVLKKLKKKRSLLHYCYQVKRKYWLFGTEEYLFIFRNMYEAVNVLKELSSTIKR